VPRSWHRQRHENERSSALFSAGLAFHLFTTREVEQVRRSCVVKAAFSYARTQFELVEPR
jgi:hypothetical protein